MTGSSIGQVFKVTTWGESHGEALGCVIEGVPPNLGIDEKYIQGKLKESRNYKNNQRDGPSQLYHDNGHLFISSNWKDGQLDGLYEKYDENGQLKLSQNYKDGELVE